MVLQIKPKHLVIATVARSTMVLGTENMSNLCSLIVTVASQYDMSKNIKQTKNQNKK